MSGRGLAMRIRIGAAFACLALGFWGSPGTAAPAGSMEILQCPSAAVPARPFAVEAVRMDQGIGYRIRIGRSWHRGRWVGSGIDRPRAIVTDVDFDGHPDIWITGDADAQGRARPSDVWRFDPATRRYRFDARLSALPNLEVDPVARQIESGITCGCAGACFRIDRLAFVSGRPTPVSRLEQACGPDGAAVVVWSMVSGRLTRTGTASAKPAEGRPSASPNLVDWRKGAGCSRP